MQDGSTISNSGEGRNLTVSTVSIVSPAATATPGSLLVKVLIKYPSDWKKDKFFKDGDVKEVSPETADTFVEIGIATLVNSNEAHADVADTDEEEEDVQFNDAEQTEAGAPEATEEETAPVAEPKNGGKKKAGK